MERFPSRTELQKEVDGVRQRSPRGYAAARDDFALAIRSRFSLQPPKRPDWREPHVKRGPTLGVISTRASWEAQIEKLDGMEGGAAAAQFYRDHLEEYCIDDTPELAAVALDVLLNGWDDWSKWNTERLVKVREKYPELHRVYAVRELIRLRVNEANGALLQLLADGDVPPYLWTKVRRALAELDGQFEKLQFIVDVAYSSEDVRVRKRLEGEEHGFAERASKDPRFKAFWEPYLDSPIPALKFEARKAHGLPVPNTLERIYAQQEWVAENDPDPKRREETATAIRNRKIGEVLQDSSLTREQKLERVRELRGDNAPQDP